ncbi:MAG: hypothetical protein IKJ43_01545 [Bacilli bacterium]|nr:hypothetical protein [Bacilli bacterium]
MRPSQRKSRNLIIIGLCAVVAIMAVGFAAFSQQLTINSTSEVTSNWNIRIINISTIIPSGSRTTDVSSTCDEGGTPKQCGDGLTASISAMLVSPGDSITYRIKIENKGSLNAALSSIDLNSNQSDDIGYYINKDKDNNPISDIGYRLLEDNSILNHNGDSNDLDEGYVYLTIYYKEYEGQTSPTGDNKTVAATATFNFNQSITEASPNIELSTTVADYIINSASNDSTLSNDNTSDNNLRYSGSSVNNYICLSQSDGDSCQDKHLYRIIGVFNNIKTSESDSLSETRVKVVKATNYGNNLWDDGKENNWARPASLNTILNTTYYNSLSNDAKDIIDKTVWNIGGMTNNNNPAIGAYYSERSQAHYDNDPYIWEGIMGMIQPSDYGYASSGCNHYSDLLSSYYNETCRSTNWLYTGENEWMLGSVPDNTEHIYYISPSGTVLSTSSLNLRSMEVRPSAFLKASAIIDYNGHDGSLNNPYIIKNN